MYAHVGRKILFVVLAYRLGSWEAGSVFAYEPERSLVAGGRSEGMNSFSSPSFSSLLIFFESSGSILFTWGLPGAFSYSQWIRCS